MSYEKKFFLTDTPFWLVACDEAGRGPLAGPVVAGAVAMRVDCLETTLKKLKALRRLGVKDSKVINAEKRQHILTKLGWTHGTPSHQRQLVGDGLLTAWSQCDSEEIDQINILQASLKAMLSAAVCVSESENLPVVWLIDGNRAPKAVSESWNVHPVVEGDAKSALIGLASVIAKETRDRFMQDFDTLYPQYGFKNHMGYGTEFHRGAIAQHGPTPIHRQTFSGVREHIARTEA